MPISIVLALLYRVTVADPEQVNVLSVGEHPATADLTAEDLDPQDGQFVVDTVASGTAALDRLDQAEYDCVLADETLPAMRGVGLLDRVREDYPRVPFVLVVRGDGASEAISAGATDYVRAETVEARTLASRILSAVERERTRRQRRTSTGQDRFRAAFDGAFDAMVITDDDGQCIEVNRSATRLFGLSREKLLGRSIGDFAPEETDIGVALRECSEPNGQRRTFPIVRPDGTERHVEFAATADIVPGNHLSIFRDLTERERREGKLREEQAFIEQALNTLDDPFYVVGTDGGMRRWNDRLKDVTGYDDEQIAEMDAVEFFPDSHRERIADAIETTLITGEVRVEADFLTASGERIPHDFRGAKLTDPDGTVSGLVGIGRDITERKNYERRLSALNETTTEFAQASTTAEAAEYIVTAMDEVADLPNAVVFLYADDDGVLEPAARSTRGTRPAGAVATIGPGEGAAWRVFASGEAIRRDDVRSSEHVYNPEAPIRSQLIVSLGEHGVLVAGDAQPHAFDDRTQKLAEIIAAAAEAALDSVTQTERLRERTHELDRQTRRLDRVNQLNDAVRSINRTIVSADSRDGIVETVCDRITDLEVVEFAWVGESSPDPGTLTPSAWGGKDRSYLDMRDFPIEGPATAEPALEAAQTGEMVHVPNIVRADDTGEWGTAALQQGYRSVLSVPLGYDESLYGVLVIYAGTQNVFDGAFREVLVELGDLVGLGLNTLDRRDALLGRRHITVELGVGANPDDGEPFLRLADRLDCTVEVARILPREDETLVYAACSNVTTRRMNGVVEDIPSIASVRRIRGTDPCDSEPCLFEFLASDLGLVSRLADRGIRSHTVAFERGRGRVVATVPSTVNPTTLVEELQAPYPEVTLEQTEVTRERQTVSDAVFVREALTAAQREAIEAAHQAGFFEWPRDSTSEEVAAALGISQPSFAQRLRAAQKKVFDAYCRETRIDR